MSLIELKNVQKEYELGKTKVHALRGIDLTIEKGDFVSIIGPSGSGKTTLLNIIGCIDTLTSGEARIAEADIATLSDEKLTRLRLNKLGFIFQTFNLIPVFTILENVEFPLLLMKKFTKTEIETKAKNLLDSVGLSSHLNHKPAELSGGQRQRVAIARALVTDPEIILADEPTANLDSATGATILELMRSLNEKKQTTFIFSTHDNDVLKYAKRILKIKDGKLIDA